MRTILILLFFQGLSFCQITATQFNFVDTTITQADSIVFHPERFTSCRYAYTSSYVVSADTIRITSKQEVNCRPAVGFNGPFVLLKSLPVGQYRFAFADSSNFKMDASVVQLKVVPNPIGSTRKARLRLGVVRAYKALRDVLGRHHD